MKPCVVALVLGLLSGCPSPAPNVQLLATFGGAGNDELCDLSPNGDDLTIVGTLSGPVLVGDTQIGVARAEGDARLGNAGFLASTDAEKTDDVAAFSATDVSGGGVGNVFGIVASEGSDQRFFAGTYSGSLDVDGTSDADQVGLFFGSRSAASIEWLHTFPLTLSGTPLDIAGMVAFTRVADVVKVDGDLFVAGQFFGSLDLGGGAIGEAGVETLFGSRYSFDGELLSSRVLLSQSAPFSATSVVAAPDGGALVIGVVTGDAVDFGTGEELSAGDGSVFLLSVDAGLNARFATLVPGRVESACYGAAGANASVLVIGTTVWVSTELASRAEFAGHTFIPDGTDILLTAIDGASGAVLNAFLFSGDGVERAPSLLAGRDGGVFVLGSFQDSTRFSDHDLAGGSGIYLIDADAAGNARSVQTVAQNASMRSSAAAGDGRFFFGGVFVGDAVVGDTPISAVGGVDGFVALVSQ